MTRTAVVALTKKVAARLAAGKVGGATLTRKQIERYRQGKRAHVDKKRQHEKLSVRA